MSLIAMLEQSKAVALETREQVALRNAEEIAEFEEIGADLAAALDAQELDTSEEMLRLAQELDEQEEKEVSEREIADLELAKSLLAAEQATVAAVEKDEALAQKDEELEQKDVELTQKAGTVTMAQVEEIAKIKLPDLNTNKIQSAMNSVMGTAKNMGIEVEE